MILQGKVFISTVSTHKSAEIRNLLEPMGGTVIDFPMTEIVPLEQTPVIRDIIENLYRFDWIIFTSANGVIHFHRLLFEITQRSIIPSDIKIAVVGIKTAKEVENSGRKADFISTGNTAESLANEIIGKESLRNCHILLPVGNLAPDLLKLKLSEIAQVTRIDVYKTIKVNLRDNETVERIKSNHYDMILFTSSSGIDNFMDVLSSEDIGGHELKIASIGSVTSHAAESHGLTCKLTASKSTYESLVTEIVNYYTLNK